MVDRRLANFDPPDRDSFASGFRAAARHLMFGTDDPEFPLATYGGTATLLEFEGAVYAMACAHSFGDFDWKRLVVTPGHQGGPAAPVHSIYRLSHGINETKDSEVLDLVAIRFADGITADWFIEKPKLVDAESIAECDETDLLCAIGFPAHLSLINGNWSSVAQGELQVHASARTSADPTLRHASAYIETDEHSNLNGLSGGPVFRIKDHKFCGIVVRGGISDSELANIHFVEAFDILQILRASNSPAKLHTYEKSVLRPQKK